MSATQQPINKAEDRWFASKISQEPLPRFSAGIRNDYFFVAFCNRENLTDRSFYSRQLKISEKGSKRLSRKGARYAIVEEFEPRNAHDPVIAA